MTRHASDLASSADVAHAEEIELLFVNAGPTACSQARRSPREAVKAAGSSG
jgi:hypothetical protein